MSCGKRDWTVAELQAFEQEIADLFLAKRIHAPIHLAGGNESQLIQIFRDVRPRDWVLSTHRSHLHALLHGIPPGWLRDEILAGRSMHINSAEHRFLTSAIVGGIAPIAVGLAMGIKRKGEDRQAWCFLGDAASFTGLFHEAHTYARNFELQVTFVIEDNHYCTNSPTAEIWGGQPTPDFDPPIWEDQWLGGGVISYSYLRAHEHTGTKTWVTF